MNEINDIFAPVTVPDNSLYLLVFFILLFFILFFALFYFYKKRVQKK